MRRGAEALVLAAWCAGAAQAACDKPVYLSFDTGHMQIAPLVADVLRRHDVKATFFLADERTTGGGSSLDEQWAPWWRERAAEGHAFASHTWDHPVWLADRDGGFRVRFTAGPQSGRVATLSRAEYCEQIGKPAERWRAISGQPMLPLFRAASAAGRLRGCLYRGQWSDIGTPQRLRELDERLAGGAGG